MIINPKRIIFLLYSLLAHAIVFGTEIVNLKTEYTETPIGIDVKMPRFSWQMKSNVAGSYQKAYRIVVYAENGEKVWDTGKILSAISLNIKYTGKALKPSTRYRWQVRVWNQRNRTSLAESWFETGLMQSDISAWSGAKWIGGSENDMVLYSHYLPVFQVHFLLQFDAKSASTKAGFIYGANDERLMNKNRNIFQIEKGSNESYLKVEIDIQPLASNENAILNFYRVGYHPHDRNDIPFQSFKIPTQQINNSNKYDTHQIGISTNLGYTNIEVNGQRVARLGVNPLGQGGDFIAFPMLADIGFSVPENQSATFSSIEIRNFRHPNNVIAKLKDRTIIGGKAGVFETFNPSRNSTPMLRTVFCTNKPIAKARLYITSRGIYDVYINGERLGNDFFNPGFTQYNKTHLYQTFEVTHLLQKGKNAMGAVLAEGWWSGAATYMGENWNFFGDRLSLLAKMLITYADGQEEIIVTNPETWQFFNDGPWLYASFFQGEVYDATKEKQIENWSRATYDVTNWRKATEVPLKGTIAFDEKEFSEMKLIGQFDPTVKQVKELTAISMEEVRPKVFVYDMGQNMVGVPKISLTNMKAGQIINLRFAEKKYPDLPQYSENKGMIMLENIRAALSQDKYITKGGNETIQPRFTFHGYRYVEITGIEKPLPIESVKGIVLSSVHELSSSYRTSNPKVNQLWENITWSMYGNFLSIPTDCPQRNERMGWSGDISVFSRAATYLAHLPQFFRRHMLAMRDTQRRNGRFADVAPFDVGFGGLLWGSAGITVAWETYLQYHDKDLLTEHYDAMKHYIQYILNETMEKESGLIVQNRAWGDLGDWLGLEDGRNDKSLLWESYFIYTLDLMQKMATVLNNPVDAEYFYKLSNERRLFFNKTYIQKETGKTIFSAFDESRKGRIVDTQTSYILPLVFNVASESNREKMATNFVETVTRENKSDNNQTLPPYSLMTGFIGTAWINKTLSNIGRSDIAYTLLQQTTFPSWLYPVEQGATTIWERLNSYTHTDGFGGNNRMNSFNHYSFGAVASWMYNYSLGIERDENSPGFKHFFLQPEVDPTGQMTFATGHYNSMYGRIESAWKVESGVVYYTFTIPANTSATLKLNAFSENDIRSNGKPLKSLKGVTYLGEKNNKQMFRLQSGKYQIYYVKP